MSKAFFRSGSFKRSVLTLACGVLFVGCGAPPKPIPPVFNLYGYQRMAVVPFVDQCKDSALGQAVEEEMVSEILPLNAMPVIEAVQVGAYLKSLKADPSMVATDPVLRKKIGEKFNCDILLVGTATGYNEILKDMAPEKRGSEWGFMTDRKVHVNAMAQLMDPVNGTLLWQQKNGGYSYYNTWNPLPAPAGLEVPGFLKQFADLGNLVKNRVEGKGDHEPAVLSENDPNVLLYPKSHYFAELRQKSVAAMVDAMVDDFRGHCGWSPNAR